MKIQDCLHQEILFSHSHAGDDGRVLQGEVDGFSPSGLYVCIQYNWYDVSKVSVLEVLPPAPPRPGSLSQRVQPGALSDQSRDDRIVQTSEPAKPERGPFGRKQVPDLAPAGSDAEAVQDRPEPLPPATPADSSAPAAQS